MQASIACLLLLSMVLTANAMSLGMNRVMYGHQGQTPSMKPIGSTQDTGTYTRESQGRQPGPLSGFGQTEGSYAQRFNLGLYEHQGTTNGSPGQEGRSGRLVGGTQVPFLDKGFGHLPQYGPLDQGSTSQGYGGFQNKVSGHLPQYSPLSQRLTETQQGYGGGLYGGLLDKSTGHLPQYVPSNKGLSSWGNGGYKDPLSGHSKYSPLSQGLTSGAYQGYGGYQDKLSGHQYGPPRQSLTTGGYQDKLVSHSTPYGPLGGYGSGLYGGFQDKPLGNSPQYVPSNQYLTSGGYLGYRAGYQDKPSGHLPQYVPLIQGLTSGGYQGYRGYLPYYIPSSQGLTSGGYLVYRGGSQDKPSGYLLYYVPLSQGLTSGGYLGYLGYQDMPSGYLPQYGPSNKGLSSWGNGGYPYNLYGHSQYSPLSQGLTSGSYQGYGGGLYGGYQDKLLGHQYGPLRQGLTSGGYGNGLYEGYQDKLSGYLPQYGPLQYGRSSVGNTAFGGFQDSLLGHLGHSSPSSQGLRSGDYWGRTGGLQGGFDQERYFKEHGLLHQRPALEKDVRDGGFQANQSGILSQNSSASQGLTTLGYQGTRGFQDKLSGHQQPSAPIHQGSISGRSHGGYLDTFLRRFQHHGPSDHNATAGGARRNVSSGLQGRFQERPSGHLQAITPPSQGATTKSGGLQGNVLGHPQQHDPSDKQMRSGGSLGNGSQGMPSGYLQDRDSSGKRNEDNGPKTKDDEPAL